MAQAQLFKTTDIDRSSFDDSTVFTPNMRLPIHRWFRYSAGFSAAWVEREIRRRQRDGADPPNVLDPFAGSGTTLISAQLTDSPSIGMESHPFVARVASAKLRWTSCPDELEERGRQVLESCSPEPWPDPPDLMEKVFPANVLAELNGLRGAVVESATGTAADELLWLGLVAILRACSPVGTAQWQYVLPNKTKARVASPLAAFAAQIRAMATDMRELAIVEVPATRLLRTDARTASVVPDDWADLVITSPPYPNNFDYADATRIEMTFLSEIKRWGDLQGTVRSLLIRSCSQHMAGYDGEAALEDPILAPIADELAKIFHQLDEVRLSRAGRKAYHLMVVAYFHDLAHTWAQLRKYCRSGSEVLFVVGDSAPYGVHVPVQRWLGELAIASGFEAWSFTKLRDRNVKWKNRKHRVPLQEGVLHVVG